MFQLIHKAWKSEFDNTIKFRGELLIISPFIFRAPALRLAKAKTQVRVITRFDLNSFFAGASDLSALRGLVERGAEVRGIRHLHSKAYIFGKERAIVTSANLTEAALSRNHEFGFVAEDDEIVSECRRYFESIWARAGRNLTLQKIGEWESELESCADQATSLKARTKLRDYGVDIGLQADPPSTVWISSLATPAFVKFQGTARGRIDPDSAVIDEIAESETNWACCYPRNRRPRDVGDGDVMFLGRMVKPNDTRIYGRAIAQAYRPRLDDASSRDVQRRNWKANWPHYVRLLQPIFIAGDLRNGISLNELMSELKTDAFEPTQRNRREGTGNTDPRRSIVRKPAIRLSREGSEWLNTRFLQAVNSHGSVSAAELMKLYRPD